MTKESKILNINKFTTMNTFIHIYVRNIHICTQCDNDNQSIMQTKHKSKCKARSHEKYLS